MHHLSSLKPKDSCLLMPLAKDTFYCLRVTVCQSGINLCKASISLQPHVTSFIFNKLSLPSLSLSSRPLFLPRRHFNESVWAPFRPEMKISIQRLNKFSPASLDVGLSSSVPFAPLSASFWGQTAKFKRAPIPPLSQAS